jgi:Bacterial Ig domain
MKLARHPPTRDWPSDSTGCSASRTSTDRQRAVRTDRWKLIRTPVENQVQLFDVKKDPWGMRNLVTDPIGVTNETVILQLHPWIDREIDGLVPYNLGWPSNALVTIAETVTPHTNQPPLVRLLSPADNAGFIAPATIQLVAQARDPDGTVTNVEFFAGTTSLGTGTNTMGRGFYPGLFSLTWSNVAKGNYVITAVVTDNLGATNTSAPITVRVISNPMSRPSRWWRPMPRPRSWARIQVSLQSHAPAIRPARWRSTIRWRERPETGPITRDYRAWSTSLPVLSPPTSRSCLFRIWT